jgi:hypothetical protein
LLTGFIVRADFRCSLAEQKVQKHEAVLLCTVHISSTCSNRYVSTKLTLTIILQSSAQNALELHGRELEPGRPISVLISNPERKKERTDADANEKEIYVAGLSKFTTTEDLIKLFKTVSLAST